MNQRQIWENMIPYIGVIAFFFLINRLYFLEQFQVYRKIEWKITEFPHNNPQTHTVSSRINILHQCNTCVIIDESIDTLLIKAHSLHWGSLFGVYNGMYPPLPSLHFQYVIPNSKSDVLTPLLQQYKLNSYLPLPQVLPLFSISVKKHHLPSTG